MSTTDDLYNALIIIRARHSMDCTNTQEIIDWAYSALELGIDTPSLCILAGLAGSSQPEIEFYLEKALHEIGWKLPSREDFPFEYAKHIARLIKNRKLASREGCAELARIAAHTQHDELAVWYYFDEHYDLIEDGIIEYDVRKLDEEVLEELMDFLETKS
jgi:hypothetical protein